MDFSIFGSENGQNPYIFFYKKIHSLKIHFRPFQVKIRLVYILGGRVICIWDGYYNPTKIKESIDIFLTLWHVLLCYDGSSQGTIAMLTSRQNYN